MLENVCTLHLIPEIPLVEQKKKPKRIAPIVQTKKSSSDIELIDTLKEEM
jgi:hypothetical protein